jgi:peptidoglycan LD-endopeptidase LytH
MSSRLTIALVPALALVLAASCAGGTRPGGPSTARTAVDEGPIPQRTTTAPPSPGSTGTSVGPARRLDRRFPVRGNASYSRAHHDYPATDIFAGCGSRVVAPVRGTVLEFGRRDRYRPRRDNPALRGGRFVSMRGADGVRYYGSHLRSVASHMRKGKRVRVGQLLGRVGQSGNARGVGCHLHFGISPVCARTGDWWVRRGAVRPYRFLRAWQRGRDRSPKAAVRRWRAQHGCPSRPR